MFDNLDQLLKTRKKPDVPEYLSARIIAAAARRSRVSADQEVYGLAAFRADLQAMVRIPISAFALGVLALFILGAFMGASSGDGVSFLPGITADELASFMMINDGFVAGEWV